MLQKAVATLPLSSAVVVKPFYTSATFKTFVDSIEIPAVQTPATTWAFMKLEICGKMCRIPLDGLVFVNRHCSYARAQDVSKGGKGAGGSGSGGAADGIPLLKWRRWPTADPWIAADDGRYALFARCYEAKNGEITLGELDVKQMTAKQRQDLDTAISKSEIRCKTLGTRAITAEVYYNTWSSSYQLIKTLPKKKLANTYLTCHGVLHALIDNIQFDKICNGGFGVA
jgi:hypothetical protein